MSEFNFACPVCGRNIVYDTATESTQHICPHCNNTVGVPKGFADHTEVPPQTDTSPEEAGPGTTAAAPQTSRLAVASLVCSLASVVTCIGWIPGIICGYLARSRIRRDPSLKGDGLAMAGLTIGYLFLMLEAGTAAYYISDFSNAVNQGIANVRQGLATNGTIVTRIQFATAPSDNQQAEPVKPVAVVASQRQTELAASGWTSDVSRAAFPDHPVGGKLHGTDFEFKAAMLRGANLRINSGNGLSLDILGLAEPVEGRSYEIQPSDGGAIPRVRMSWNERDVFLTATYRKGCGMKLEFGQAVNRTIPAKIYLCFPDDSKSCVAGTFEVRILKPQ